MDRKFRHCHFEEKQNIIRCRVEGMSIRKIAKLFNRSPTTIANIKNNNGIRETKKLITDADKKKCVEFQT